MLAWGWMRFCQWAQLQVNWLQFGYIPRQQEGCWAQMELICVYAHSNRCVILKHLSHDCWIIQIQNLSHTDCILWHVLQGCLSFPPSCWFQSQVRMRKWARFFDVSPRFWSYNCKNDITAFWQKKKSKTKKVKRFASQVTEEHTFKSNRIMDSQSRAALCELND